MKCLQTVPVQTGRPHAVIFTSDFFCLFINTVLRNDQSVRHDNKTLVVAREDLTQSDNDHEADIKIL